MQENIYVIYDTGTGIALKPPMVDKNDVQPIRVLTDTILQAGTNNVIANHRKDFQLIHIGTLDLETLEINKVEPRLVAQAIDLVPYEDNKE